ncbi:phosphoadenylyl-sulfate reductase [Salsuginibacillus kocurii]|uniref:phosphoadenylyl-sulfate reductase n=1 Tax=Salsuginibacillus kocurii TaxID=427078 RepID=UPI00036BC725|nr:phosphoadenylyl-sulfate reductase [Salsuginibacillus kocurii]
MYTYETLDIQSASELNETTLAGKTAKEVIRWAYATYGNDLVYACSLGAEGMVLLDLIAKEKSDANVIFLDTDFHFDETYELLNQVRTRFPSLNIQALKPALTPEEQADQHGERLWETHPDQCCAIRKLDPLEKGLKPYNAWMSGLRRAQGPTRAETPFVGRDERFQSVKICPLIHWTLDDVWAYIEVNNLPYNKLHDENYPSIGCTHCTAPVAPGEDERSGRWSQFGKTECGLHRA